MIIDKTTLQDLSIFHSEEEFSLFNQLNFTQTGHGKEWLHHLLSEPFSELNKITETQNILKLIINRSEDWPTSITNGTIMVIERFYETVLNTIPASSGQLNAYSYYLLHGPDYSLVKYSVTHFADFVRGMWQLAVLFDQEGSPAGLLNYTSRIKYLLKHNVIEKLISLRAGTKLSRKEIVYYGHYIRYHFKSSVTELINIYGRFDAWYSMAKAVVKHNLHFPVFIHSEEPTIEAKGLYHILVPNPIAYDIKMDRENHFVFLTGANMAGKSTFIKAVGAGIYLAHLGMGVPATNMRLTLFDGILSNINVADNIAKGESYFFNEVQRIKNTILKINDGRKWLVLIDELFKGTNIQDAMKCSSTVIKGLIKIRTSLFILSTHLYEIGEELKVYPGISFKYFETKVKGDQLEFNYQLREGVSNDRLGYLILQREKVVELLEKL